MSDLDSPRDLVNRGGRPSRAPDLLTPETLVTIGKLLAEGQHKETVADYVGVPRSTWWDWEQRGKREPESLYGEFLEVITRSLAFAEISLIREIRQGAEGWQSKAWLTERRFTERWGRRLDVTLRREAERIAEESGLDAAELLAEAERIAGGITTSGRT